MARWVPLQGPGNTRWSTCRASGGVGDGGMQASVFTQMTNGCAVGDLRVSACVAEQCTEDRGHSCLVADVAVSCVGVGAEDG